MQAATAKKLEADVLKLDAKLKEVGEKMQRQLKKYATMYAKNLVSMRRRISGADWC